MSYELGRLIRCAGNSEGVTWIVAQSQVAPFCLGDVDGADRYAEFLLGVATQ
jgi:hypothetical protein